MNQEQILNDKYQPIKEIKKDSTNNKQKQSLIAIDINTQKKVFIKKLYGQFNEYDEINFQNELKTYKKVQSRNVIQYIEDFQENQSKYLVLEYFEYDKSAQQEITALTLKEYLQYRKDQQGGKGTVNEIEAISIIKQILNGFRAIHNQIHLLHQNVALDNLLISKEGQIKIIGFSICKILNTFELSCSIKEPFRQQQIPTTAPEILFDDSLHQLSSDIYSIGAIFYKLIFGKYPYNLDEYLCSMDDILELSNNFKDDQLQFDPSIVIQETTKSLMIQMLRRNPKNRITFMELNKSDLFQQQYQNLNNNSIAVDFANKLDLMKNSIIYENQVEIDQKYLKKIKNSISQSVKSKAENKKKLAQFTILSTSQEKANEYSELQKYCGRMVHIEFICYTIEEIYKNKLRKSALLSFLLLNIVIKAAKYLKQKFMDIQNSITHPEYVKQLQSCLAYLQQDLPQYQLAEFRNHVIKIYGENHIIQIENMNEDKFNNYFKQIILNYMQQCQSYKRVHIHILYCCTARDYKKRVIQISQGDIIDLFSSKKIPSQGEINSLINQLKES